MTITNEDELQKLKAAGRVVAHTLAAMSEAIEPGITTRELDGLGRRLLEAEGARSAPELTYGFPAATCISIDPDVAHGVPGDARVAPGDLINIDVSAELDGFFADTGASFAVPPVAPRIKQLCRDGRRALWRGIRRVAPGAALNAPGQEIEAFARRNGYSLVKNLASHGVGAALHEEPKEIATWADHSDRRKISEGLVFTLEPFLSLGAATVAESSADGWTLAPQGGEPTVQYEHTIVATRRGPVVVTLA
jgi:methionyl aminopeptidase